ncbi:NYN domain-containing protein [Dietzia sp.]|uniref:NYN domain-containing protein n=1 Tax=Dietzia sp. TaxID=1871616 RepID=UPI002FDB2B4F
MNSPQSEATPGAPSGDGADSRDELAAGGAHSSDSHSPAPGPGAGPDTGSAHEDDGEGVVLLVWDAPNLDMGLGAILGGRPTSAYRPRFDALGRWLLGYTADVSRRSRQELSTEATVFTNIVPGQADVVRPWVEALRNVGYAVFAKPKSTEDSDVDEDMLEHIDAIADAGRLAGLVVASADGQAFREPLEELAEDIPVSVIGFREHATWATQSDVLEFVDLEDIDGVFREPLPRISLDNLPVQGAWLQPFRPLATLLRSR